MFTKPAATTISAALTLLLAFTASCQPGIVVTDNETPTTNPVTTQLAPEIANTEETFVHVHIEYAEPLRSLDHALEYTDLIVDATVEEAEQFAPGTMQYRLKVDAHHYGSTPEGEDLFMYFTGNPLDLGEQYLLFLSVDAVTLYPHAVASPVYEIVLPSDTDRLYHMGVRFAESRNDLFAELMTKDGFDEVYLTESPAGFATLEEAWQESDQVSLVTIGSETAMNPFVSVYQVTFKDGWSSTGSVSSRSPNQLLLPPGLERGQDYYLALDRDEDGNLHLAGAENTVIESGSAESTELGALIG